MSSPSPQLPYQDTKPQGAADFYYAINATFRFMIDRLGVDGWQRYLEELGRDYYANINGLWRQGGLSAIGDYWRAFFAAEPGAKVEVVQHVDRVQVSVHHCPAIGHLRTQGRPMVPQFCQHCFHLNQARAVAAGFEMRLTGGNGCCQQVFYASGAAPGPQDMTEIKEAAL